MDMTEVMTARLLRQDPPRPGKKITYRVDSTSSGVCGPAGVAIGFGEQIIEIHEADEKALLALVEDFRDPKGREIDPELVDRELEYALEEAKKVDSKGESAGNPRPYPPSYAAAFREVMKRDMKPLRSAQRVVDEKKKAA